MDLKTNTIELIAGLGRSLRFRNQSESTVFSIADVGTHGYPGQYVEYRIPQASIF